MGVVDPKAGTVGTVCHGMSYGCGAAQWGNALHEEECESTTVYSIEELKSSEIELLTMVCIRVLICLWMSSVGVRVGFGVS